MRRACYALPVLLASLTLGAQGAGAAIVYTQPTDLNGGYSAQNDTNGFGAFATVFDDFTLGAGAAIGRVSFTGSYFNPPSQGTITGFTVQFYADNAGQPGASIYSASFAGAAGETSLGSDNFSDPAFSYAVDLPTAFNAAGGTKYWMSVVPDLGFPPQWGWESGTGGDGVAYQDFFGTRTQLSVDLAFTLEGNPIPEPASLMLLGAGLAGLGAARRRRAA